MRSGRYTTRFGELGRAWEGQESNKAMAANETRGTSKDNCGMRLGHFTGLVEIFAGWAIKAVDLLVCFVR